MNDTYMDRLIEEYREEQREMQNAELRASLRCVRSTEELFSALLALAPQRADERVPVLT
ncbi:MAG: hypothetical protein K2N74_00555 [Clostridiales bacterium]|nr:hypothetical protein [Clostridiales bacterium]